MAGHTNFRRLLDDLPEERRARIEARTRELEQRLVGRKKGHRPGLRHADDPD